LEFAVKLGSGTSGTVYKGLYKGSEVAIKVLKAEQSQKELEEFKKEFQIMSSIQSPYLVFFFGACLEPKLCMVMEFCGKGSLYHVMNDLKMDIGWDKVINLSKEMVRGVDCLHSHDPSIVHRDFKSLNLMVNDQLHVKVGDFGLSRFNTDTQKETLSKMRGTFAYCAPEVYFGEQFSTKSDVFSIAIVLWELGARCMKREYLRPYQEYPNLHFDFQIIIQTAKKDLRPTIPPNTPDSFVNLMKVCWSKDAKERPDCKEVLAKLDAMEKEYLEKKADWDSRIDPPKP
jgi:serine/threonine protein kinase